MSTARALLALLLVVSGCASTGGRAWIDSPIEERTAPASVEVAQAEPAPDARPRLNRTVTLGETYASVPTAPAGAPAATGVQVNVTTQVPVTIHNGGGYGYYGYGYGYPVSRSVAPSSAPVRSSGGAPQTVGGNWPAIPDYGPKAMR